MVVVVVDVLVDVLLEVDEDCEIESIRPKYSLVRCLGCFAMENFSLFAAKYLVKNISVSISFGVDSMD